MRHSIHQRLDLPRPWGHLTRSPAPSVVHRIRAGDGQELVLRRMRPSGPDAAGEPVMLLHGLAANHRSFHLPERSLALWLAARGYDVWLPELRGHGDSRTTRFDWRFDHYLHHDLPAIVDAILSRSGADRLHWVGHSMGGLLLFCYGILHPQAPIASGVAVGSALDYRVGSTGFRKLLALRPVLERLVAVPYGTLVHLLAPLMGRRFKALEAFNVWPSNIEPAVTRSIHAQCFHTIPMSLLISLATTFEPGGLRLEEGLRFVDHAPRFEPPLLLMAGSRDAQVSPEAVENTAALIGENARARILGIDHGEADEYGHFDLLMGRRADAEVWPKIVEWMESL